MKTGIERIAAERQRQIDAKGWTLENDDEHQNGELNEAARTYAEYSFQQDQHESALMSSVWPWPLKWWKPSEDPIRNLEKAGALIAAEIDRLQRLQNRTS